MICSEYLSLVNLFASNSTPPTPTQNKRELFTQNYWLSAGTPNWLLLEAAVTSRKRTAWYRVHREKNTGPHQKSCHLDGSDEFVGSHQPLSPGQCWIALGKATDPGANPALPSSQSPLEPLSYQWPSSVSHKWFPQQALAGKGTEMLRKAEKGNR